ncbi:kinase-like protein [Gymnopus androsaceus JB14]|uniref:Kinase-like protein n=1 Tax=Gymnopus androsaceus JB14 TaxID=1447944 RepID=A0A6A4HIV8_9AGAR|nr:kinase-like protein [Gymnopus androsaceus JB14]
MFLDSDAKLRSKVLHAFCNEALLWRQLKHQNVHPLLGVSTSLFAPSFCFISPWMQNGDINQHMRVNPAFDKLTALTEIMAGLNYLHGLTPPVVHGDLRGANILVTSNEPPRCCLADFGLALVAETQTLTSTSEMRGASRWLSPEHIDPSAFRDHDLNYDRRPRDIYAFACTVVEIITEKPPFSGQLLTDSAVIIQVLNGARPSRPESVWCSEKLWDLVKKSWGQEPRDRPSAAFIHASLQSILLSRQH